MEKKKTMSVAEMRTLLGLKKTESYWLVHKNCFDTITINGKMRVVIDSFEKWYANQVKHKKVDGPPPGEELRAMSYSISEIAALLGISDDSAYSLIERYHIETFMVDYWKRVRKDVFEEWYATQYRYRNQEDRALDDKLRETSISMPEMARALLIPRSKVYCILQSPKNAGAFAFVDVAGQKRITKDSFEAWYSSQNQYFRFEDRPPEEQEKIVQAEKLSVMPILAVDPDKKAYSIQEAMVLLGLCREQVLELIHAGELEAKRYANKYMILRDDISWWLFQQKLQQEN